jgi:hypothetical protein
MGAVRTVIWGCIRRSIFIMSVREAPTEANTFVRRRTFSVIRIKLNVKSPSTNAENISQSTDL